MGQRLPRVTARELLAALRRDGWEPWDQRGSHLQLTHPTKPGRVTLPMHGSQIIKPGTLAGILKQAKLSTDELRNLL